MKSSSRKYERVRKLIREERRRQPPMRTHFLSRLNGCRADKRSANKFLLGCIIDYQMRVGRVWENARRFAEDDLGDPRDLWDKIVEIPSGTPRRYAVGTTFTGTLPRMTVSRESARKSSSDMAVMLATSGRTNPRASLRSDSNGWG